MKKISSLQEKARKDFSETYYDISNYIEDTKEAYCKVLTAYESFSNLILSVLADKELPSSYFGKILGNKSHASDILGNKRAPSLAEMKTIKTYLGIPYDVQMAYHFEIQDTSDKTKYEKALVQLMKYNNYCYKTKKKKEEYLEYLIDKTFMKEIDKTICFRQAHRKNSKANQYALELLIAEASVQAKAQERKVKYSSKKIDNLMDELVHTLSPTTQGIKKVKDLLLGYGIKFIMIKHLTKTFLDGATFLDEENQPVVVMTGRYDRVDNFWFTLLHELAHIKLEHLSSDKPIIFDDLDIFSSEDIEIEADKLARETMLKEAIWAGFEKESCTASDILDFAMENRISPAIIAGRIRFETKNYRAFSSLIGNGGVRKHFPEVFGT